MIVLVMIGIVVCLIVLIEVSWRRADTTVEDIIQEEIDEPRRHSELNAIERDLGVR